MVEAASASWLGEVRLALGGWGEAGHEGLQPMVGRWSQTVDEAW